MLSFFVVVVAVLVHAKAMMPMSTKRPTALAPAMTATLTEESEVEVLEPPGSPLDFVQLLEPLASV